ncbi:MAG: hypothetical protein HY908_27270 [Myxococcales bacterium]|nr:hypothetical protein [Myxococcales bacterium]
MIGADSLYLLGGRRVLVAPDGTARSERVSAPEPLRELAAVPTAHGAVLVGRGASGIVYRFGDPLGAAERALLRAESLIGSAPGLVVVDAAGRAELYDVESGAPAELEGLPTAPLAGLSFVDASRGVALFRDAGLAATGDGGTTWRRVPVPLGARVRGLALRAGMPAVEVVSNAGSRHLAIDVPAGRLLAIDAPDRRPLDTWLRAGGGDPLVLAVEGGVRASAGGALVVAADFAPESTGGHRSSGGLAARVDLATGVVLETVATAASCRLAPRDPSTLWAACGEPGAVQALRAVPRELAALERTRLAASPVELRIPPSATLLVADGGTALVDRPCDNGPGSSLCVRTATRAWTTVARPPELGAAPAASALGTETGAPTIAVLPDGRIAFLTGLDGSARAVPLPQLLSDGQVSALPSPKLDGREIPRLAGSIAVDESGALCFVVTAGAVAYSVRVDDSGAPARVRPIAGASVALLHGRHGIALGRGVSISGDTGATWREVEAPGGLRAEARAGAQGPLAALSELGARVGEHWLVGWDDPEAPPLAGDPPAPPPPSPERHSGYAPHRPMGVVRCKRRGAVEPAPATAVAKPDLRTGASPDPDDVDDDDVSDSGKIVEGQDGWRGTLRTRRDARGARTFTLTLTERDSPNARAEQSWSVSAPAGDAARAALLSVARTADGGLFGLRGAASYVLRGRPNGAFELAQTSKNAAKIFHARGGGGAPIVWSSAGGVFVWREGAAPARATRLAGEHALSVLGVEGERALLGSHAFESTRVRWLDLPRPGTPADELPFDGWLDVTPLTAGRPMPRVGAGAAASLELASGSLPACGDGSAPAMFVGRASAPELWIDGIRYDQSYSEHSPEVRFDPAAPDGACIGRSFGKVTPPAGAVDQRPFVFVDVRFGPADAAGFTSKGERQALDCTLMEAQR